jgi:hypothetical protein
MKIDRRESVIKEALWQATLFRVQTEELLRRSRESGWDEKQEEAAAEAAVGLGEALNKLLI